MTQMNLSMKHRIMDKENTLGVAKGERRVGRVNWEFGISRFKLRCKEWINNKVLLYSTGPGINHSSKGYKK